MKAFGTQPALAALEALAEAVSSRAAQTLPNRGDQDDESTKPPSNYTEDGSIKL